MTVAKSVTPRSAHITCPSPNSIKGHCCTKYFFCLQRRLPVKFRLQLTFRHYISGAIIVIAMIVLAAVGFWNPGSPRYWRRPTQGTLFFAAHYAPRFLAVHLTRWAILTHVSGMSYEEYEEAASLFKQAGENQRSSQLWMALANIDIDSGNYDKAKEHSNLAYEAHPCPDPLIALVILTKNSPDERSSRMDTLQTNYPQHEFSKAWDCYRKFESFGNDLPGSCGEVDWVSQMTRDNVHKYQQTSQRIIDLPREARRLVNQLKSESRELVEKQRIYARKIKGIDSKIAYLDRERKNALVQAGINMLLPLPQPGDTFESWVVREGICALPIVRWFCRAAELGPYFELEQQKQRLASHRAEIDGELLGIKARLESIKSDVSYWQSMKPKEQLIAARDSLIPAFREEFENKALARWMQVSVPACEAIKNITCN